MGAYSPAPLMTPALIDRTMAEIVGPTVKAMAARGTPFVGVLYAGLMITAEGPQLIEYNVRFGDPEAQVLAPCGWTATFWSCLLATGRDGQARRADARGWSAEAALTVVMAAGSGATPAPTGRARRSRCDRTGGGTPPAFRSSTPALTMAGDRLVSAGGRVLDVTARAPTIAVACPHRPYSGRGAESVFPGGFYRHDIGARALVLGRKG